MLLTSKKTTPLPVKQYSAAFEKPLKMFKNNETPTSKESNKITRITIRSNLKKQLGGQQEQGSSSTADSSDSQNSEDDESELKVAILNMRGLLPKKRAIKSKSMLFPVEDETSFKEFIDMKIYKNVFKRAHKDI